jgi:hypothetical protein
VLGLWEGAHVRTEERSVRGKHIREALFSVGDESSYGLFESFAKADVDSNGVITPEELMNGKASPEETSGPRGVGAGSSLAELLETRAGRRLLKF